MSTAAVATGLLAACVSALKDAADGLGKLLGDKRQPVPEITDALRIVGTVHARLLLLHQEVSDLDERNRELAQDNAELAQWHSQSERFERRVIDGVAVFAHPDWPGAYFCVRCSSLDRVLVPIGRDRTAQVDRLCPRCGLGLYAG